MKLWYEKPASKWLEALPIGNGRLGAMLYGGTDRDTIQINEETLWSGGPHDYNQSGAADHLQAVRELIFNDDIEQAQQLFSDKMRGEPYCLQAYVPFCSLLLDVPGLQACSHYRRELDLERAMHTVRYEADGVTYTREAFCSHPDQAIIIRLSASERQRINVDAAMETIYPGAQVTVDRGHRLSLTGCVGRRDEAKRSWIAGWDGDGLRFEAGLEAIPEGGSVSFDGDRLQIRDADAVVLIITGATSFVNYRDIGGNPAETVNGYFAALQGRSYDELAARHVEDYSRLYRRVQIELGDRHGDAVPTDRRIETIEDTEDPGVAALYYQYARYLLIASSRPGGQPANLQGIWNEEQFPLWGSKWTTNINVQMNYWAAESGNLSECHLPLFDLIDDLRITGAETAAVHYGCGGFVVHHNTDLWRGAAPVDADAGVWPMGGVWLAQHLWDHYEYAPDLHFLRDRVYPVFRDAAEFMLDFLVEAPSGSKFEGLLVTNPSYSPENHYIDCGNRRRYLTYAATLDIQLIRDLFERCIMATKLLGADEAFRERLHQALLRLPDMQIGRYGQLQEWAEDWDRPDDHNSHVSHLYGLYPGNQISVRYTPALAAAVGRSLELRGNQDYGAWPAAWRIALHAHLRDRDMAHRRFITLISQSANPNMLNLRPPLPMQIDGNFGGAAGITEMLVQSRARYDASEAVYEIDLLPALPDRWADGSVKGLRARGGFELDFSWADGKLTRLQLRSGSGSACVIHYGDKKLELHTTAGQTYPIRSEEQRLTM
jgi:alpha-L-fucosidase 2